MILSIVEAWYPDYQAQRWQQYLIYVLLVWLATGMNIFGHALVPMYNKLIR